MCVFVTVKHRPNGWEWIAWDLGLKQDGIILSR